MLRWIARAIGISDRIAHVLAYVSGAVLVLLALFITVDVLGRRYGGPYTGATDEISVFAMAAAVTWALAYTSVVGKHIRIDLTLPLLSPKLRRVADYGGMALLAVFASLLAVNCWRLAWESLEIGSISMSKLSVPLVYPQALMAAGFTFLAIHAFITLLAAPYCDLDALHDAHRGEADAIADI